MMAPTMSEATSSRRGKSTILPRPPRGLGPSDGATPGGPRPGPPRLGPPKLGPPRPGPPTAPLAANFEPPRSRSPRILSTGSMVAASCSILREVQPGVRYSWITGSPCVLPLGDVLPPVLQLFPPRLPRHPDGPAACLL